MRQRQKFLAIPSGRGCCISCSDDGPQFAVQAGHIQEVSRA